MPIVRSAVQPLDKNFQRGVERVDLIKATQQGGQPLGISLLGGAVRSRPVLPRQTEDDEFRNLIEDVACFAASEMRRIQFPQRLQEVGKILREAQFSAGASASAGALALLIDVLQLLIQKRQQSIDDGPAAPSCIRVRFQAYCLLHEPVHR